MVEMDKNGTVSVKKRKRLYVGALSTKKETDDAPEIESSPSKLKKQVESGESATTKKIVSTKQRRAWKREAHERKLARQEGRKLEQRNQTSEIDTKNMLQERMHTISIAVPGSILKIAQSKELQTYLVGQIARAAAIYKINEIVVFDDTGTTRSDNAKTDDLQELSESRRHCLKMARILQYLECPQYLRKIFFPFQKDLEYAGILNPLDAPHHLRKDEHSLFREGVVSVCGVSDKKGSLVNIGLQHDVRVDKKIQPNTRVTVKLLNEPGQDTRKLRGTLVSPDAPQKEMGLYWGYKVRIAHSLGSVFSECTYKDGYDVTIGTSDKGTSVYDLSLSKFRHMLVVFGGMHGLEASLEADERLDVEEVPFLFDHYINTCIGQGSRTIRTEEAILVSLASLQPQINASLAEHKC